MNKQKHDFLEHQLLVLAAQIDPEQKPLWGKMNAQQMLEHTAKFFQVSTNKREFPMVTPVEHLPKYLEFLWSEKDFKENTKAPVLPEEPLPLDFENYGDSLNLLRQEVDYFYAFFKEDPLKTTLHPVFGMLNFEGWVQLHHKHVIHHLKQFGVAL